jgi:hypothetical protein
LIWVNDCKCIAAQDNFKRNATTYGQRNHAHVRQPENMVDEHFAAYGFAGRNLCRHCRANRVGNDTSGGSEDVAGGGWLSGLAEWQPKLRELQAVHRTVLLPDR